MLFSVVCLAQALYYEARSESIEGKLMVAEVIYNRMEDGNFPTTVCEVVYQEDQFPWSDNPPPIKEAKLWGESMKLAAEIQLGKVELPGSEALYFHSGKKPKGFKGLTLLGKVENHTFYTD